MLLRMINVESYVAYTNRAAYNRNFHKNNRWKPDVDKPMKERVMGGKDILPTTTYRRYHAARYPAKIYMDKRVDIDCYSDDEDYDDDDIRRQEIMVRHNRGARALVAAPIVAIVGNGNGVGNGAIDDDDSDDGDISDDGEDVIDADIDIAGDEEIAGNDADADDDVAADDDDAGGDDRSPRRFWEIIRSFTQNHNMRRDADVDRIVRDIPQNQWFIDQYSALHAETVECLTADGFCERNDGINVSTISHYMIYSGKEQYATLKNDLDYLQIIITCGDYFSPNPTFMR